MSHHQEQRRKQAIARYLAGDKVEDICRQMAGSKSWLYKWRDRYRADDPNWAKERSRRPGSNPAKTPGAVEHAIVSLCHAWAQNGPGSGATAIRQALQQQGIEPVPSVRTIYRILHRHRKGVI